MFVCPMAVCLWNLFETIIIFFSNSVWLHYRYIILFNLKFFNLQLFFINFKLLQIRRKLLLKVNESHIHSGIMANHIIVTLQVSCVTQSVWSSSLREPESLGLWCVWLLECHYRDTVYRIMTLPQGPITGKDSFRSLEFPQPSERERMRERKGAEEWLGLFLYMPSSVRYFLYLMPIEESIRNETAWCTYVFISEALFPLCPDGFQSCGLYWFGFPFPW